MYITQTNDPVHFPGKGERPALAGIVINLDIAVFGGCRSSRYDLIDIIHMDSPTFVK